MCTENSVGVDLVIESHNFSDDGRAVLLLLALFALPFKSKSRLEAENSGLRFKDKLASEMQRLKAIEEAMLASPDLQISLTDPDSRPMATSEARLGRCRLQCTGRCGHGISSDRYARGDEYRLGSLTTCQHRIAGEGRSWC